MDHGRAKSIHGALARFKAEGRGVLVFLRDGAAGVPVSAVHQAGSTASEAARTRQWREIGLGAQILKDLGISSIRLLAGSKWNYVGLGGFEMAYVLQLQAIPKLRQSRNFGPTAHKKQVNARVDLAGLSEGPHHPVDAFLLTHHTY